VTLDQFTMPAFAVLAICLAITGTTWAWTPTRAGISRPNQAAQRIGTPSAATRAGLFADRFTGIASIVWSHASTTFVVSLVTLAVLVGYWAVFESGVGLRSFMQRAALLPFDTSFQPGPNAFGGWIVLLAFILVAGNGVWNPLARQLKVLPLTVRDINVLFLLTPLVTWTLIWIVLIVTHRVVSGTLPSALRLDLLVFVGGTSAVGHMLALRFKRGGAGFPWFFVPLGMATSVLSRTVGAAPTTPVSLALAAAGLAAFGIAAIVNHRTLTRSTSSGNAYQRQQLPLGLTAPGAQR
jgi:hypothetical protein